MLPREVRLLPRDDAAFTRAMRVRDEDGWLERGVRREAQELYERQNPTITVHNDRWGRRDGTPGLSRLQADTTMVQLDYPLFRGKAFVRADHVRMDAGTLEADVDGVYRGEFGSCSFAASNTPVGWQPAPACTNGLKQRATGTSVAVGWRGDHLSFDLGTTPFGVRRYKLDGRDKLRRQARRNRLATDGLTAPHVKLLAVLCRRARPFHWGGVGRRHGYGRVA